MDIGKRIRDIRVTLGFSQSSLAKELGVSQPTVAAWENGSAKPGFDNLMALTRAFHMPLHRLIPDEEAPQEQARA